MISFALHQIDTRQLLLKKKSAAKYPKRVYYQGLYSHYSTLIPADINWHSSDTIHFPISDNQTHSIKIPVSLEPMLFFVFLAWLTGSVIAGVHNNTQRRKCTEHEIKQEIEIPPN